MKIYRPIKSDWKTQGFNENSACVQSVGERAIYPYKVILGSFPGTCPVNSVKFYPLLGLKGHNGYDLACWYREPVYFSGEYDGWMKTERDAQGGIGVDVVSHVPLVPCFEGCPNGTIHYIKIRSWHLAETVGFDGKEIKQGDLIGYGDSTGASSGDHVHFGPKWCDKDGTGLHSDNGFQGAFDPTPYYENVFILDVLEVKAEALKAIDLARKVIFEVSKFLNGLKK